MSTRLVRFIPIKHGGRVYIGNIGIFGVSGRHDFIGFKPAPGKKRAGWMVVLIDPKSGNRPHGAR